MTKTYTIYKSQNDELVLVPTHVSLKDIQQSKLTPYPQGNSHGHMKNIPRFGFYHETKESFVINQIPKTELKLTIPDFLEKRKDVISKSQAIAKKLRDKDLIQMPLEKLDDALGDFPNMTKHQEQESLVNFINDYLVSIGLYPIAADKLNGEQLYYFSTIGDSLLKIKAMTITYNNNDTNLLLSNVNMKLSLIKLGWSDFSRMNHHLSGTFFECIYYIAHLQKNEPVIALLERTLFGNIESVYSDTVNSLNDIFEKPTVTTGFTDSQIETIIEGTVPTRGLYPLNKSLFIFLMNDLLSKGLPNKTISLQLGITDKYLAKLYKEPSSSTRTHIIKDLYNIKKATD